MLFGGEKLVIHITVRNARTKTELGDAKIEIDELIDPKLRDLAKEYCICLNRSHILLDLQNEKVAQGKKKEDV